MSAFGPHVVAAIDMLLQIAGGEWSKTLNAIVVSMPKATMQQRASDQRFKNLIQPVLEEWAKAKEAFAIVSAPNAEDEIEPEVPLIRKVPVATYNQEKGQSFRGGGGKGISTVRDSSSSAGIQPGKQQLAR